MNPLEAQVPTQMHPLIVADMEAAEAAKHPVEPVDDAAPVTPDDESSAAPEATPDPFAGKLVIDQSNLYQEIMRLRDTDEKFRQTLDTYTGRAAKRRYEPELETLRAELEQAKFESRRTKFAAMSPADIEEKYRTDSTFAREYTEAVHGKGVDVDAVRDEVATRAAIAREFDRAEDAGVTKERRDQIQQWVASGAFDSYQGRQLAPLEAFAWFKEVVDSDITATRTWQAQQAEAAKAAAAPAPRTETPSPTAGTSAAAPQKAVAPQANLRLSEATPDLSQPQHGNTAGGRMSWEDYKSLDVAERMKRYPTTRDVERALQSGELYKS